MSSIKYRPTRNSTTIPQNKAQPPLPAIESAQPELLQKTVQDPHNASPDRIIQLQRIIGNQAVMRLINNGNAHPLQRMPNVNTVITSSSLKGNKKEGKFGPKYQQIINDIRTLDTIYDGTMIGDTIKSVTDIFQRLLVQLDTVEASVKAYLAGQQEKKYVHKSKTRDNYARSLLDEIAKDRRIIAKTMVDVATSEAIQHKLPRWANLSPRYFLFEASIGGRKFSQHGNIGTLTDDDAQRDESGKIKTVGGGTNKLTEMKQGYFKENLDDIQPGLQWGSTKDQNLWYVSQDAGIHAENTENKNSRMAYRDVAMSRLDQLLGANVITPSEIMIYKMGGGKEALGVLSQTAKGTEAGKHGQQDGFSLTQEGATDGKTYVNDPGLQRFLSRLQLIDNIAFQVDRQNSNYYLKFDHGGKVIGITGIDNDMAMGEGRTDPGDTTSVKMSKYPGLSLLVDRELAERIMALDTNVLAVAMADLLTRGEIGALITRLENLKAHLGSIQDKWLDPDQWNEETAQALRKEERSYFANLAQQVLKINAK